MTGLEKGGLFDSVKPQQPTAEFALCIQQPVCITG